jgi:hypothetical protein
VDGAAVTTLVSAGALLAGVGLGGLLARRNEKRAQSERLLVEALNDAMTAIAHVAAGDEPAAQGRYASAVSRIALHAPPTVLSEFRRFQEVGNTTAPEGRTRLIAAIQSARSELRHGRAENDDIAYLIFGHAARHEP